MKGRLAISLGHLFLSVQAEDRLELLYLYGSSFYLLYNNYMRSIAKLNDMKNRLCSSLTNNDRDDDVDVSLKEDEEVELDDLDLDVVDVAANSKKLLKMILGNYINQHLVMDSLL